MSKLSEGCTLSEAMAEHLNKLPTFEQIKAAALKVMTDYRSDLNIDEAIIAENKGVPFLHFVRDTGTVIVFLPPFEKLPQRGQYVPHLFGAINRDNIVHNIVSMAEHCANPHNGPYLLAHHFDGVKVRKITLEKAVEIAKQHAHKLREQIRKESR